MHVTCRLFRSSGTYVLSESVQVCMFVILSKFQHMREKHWDIACMSVEVIDSECTKFMLHANKLYILHCSVECSVSACVYVYMSACVCV